MEFGQILKSCKSLASKNNKSWQWLCQKLNFKGIKFPLKIGDIRKYEKRIPSTLVFLVMKIDEKYPIFVSKKCCQEKHIELLLLGKEGRRPCSY